MKLGYCQSRVQAIDRPAPCVYIYLRLCFAGLTQLAEWQLPKLQVAGSNPVSRSKRSRGLGAIFVLRPKCALGD